VIDAVSDIPDTLVQNGVPTVVGYKADGGIAVDACVGNGVSTGYTLAFNWYSGELSFLPNVSVQAVGGTPGVVSGGASGKLFLANGATSNDMLTGPAHVFGGEVGADAVAKLSLVGEYGWSVENHWGNSPDGPGMEQITAKPAIDPKSGMEVNFRDVGISVGVNAEPNIVEIRGSWSPGTNYTWNLLTVDLY
jgi:hypothetical protein